MHSSTLLEHVMTSSPVICHNVCHTHAHVYEVRVHWEGHIHACTKCSCMYMYVCTWYLAIAPIQVAGLQAQLASLQGEMGDLREKNKVRCFPYVHVSTP